MQRAHRWIRAVLSSAVLVRTSLSLAAPAPPLDSAHPAAPGASPSGSQMGPRQSQPDDRCSDEVSEWAKRASESTGLSITPRSCVAGALRLVVQGAGCDFEVSRSGGFQRTRDGAFGVSPIANLDWSTAPAPMKNALEALVTALVADPSLVIRAGQPVRHAPVPAPRAADRLVVVASLAISVTLALGVLASTRRRARPAGRFERQG